MDALWELSSPGEWQARDFAGRSPRMRACEQPVAAAYTLHATHKPPSVSAFVKLADT